MRITNSGIKAKFPTAPQYLFTDIWFEAEIDETTEDAIECTLQLIKMAEETHKKAYPYMYEEPKYLPPPTDEQLPITDLSEERTAITIENAQSLEELATVKPKDKSLMPIYVKKLKELTNTINQ
jgi:hypothetical protein